MDRKIKAAKLAEDMQVRKELKQMDWCAAIFYLLFPAAFAVIFGRKYSGVIIPVIFFFSIAYLFAFNSFLASFSDDGVRCIERWSKKYYGYRLSWVFLILTSCAITRGLYQLCV